MFDRNKVTFARHQSFGLRYSWLTKGYQSLQKDPDVFTPDQGIVSLGVGKNMVESIRYWLQACQMIEPITNQATDIGQAIFDKKTGFDPFLEDEATLWLIHWLLATNAERATAWYWFFNRFHKNEFTGQEVTAALAEFVSSNVTESKRPKQSSIQSDALLIPRMYTQSRRAARTPIEETLDSPLALLRLITLSTDGRLYRSNPQRRPQLPIGIFGFAVTQIMTQRGITMIPIEELMYSQDGHPAPGAVFRLNESDLIAKLEKLVTCLPGSYELRETAGIHQLYQLKTKKPLDYIQAHYEGALKDLAA